MHGADQHSCAAEQRLRGYVLFFLAKALCKSGWRHMQTVKRSSFAGLK
jgi:hypothetical protein